MNSSEITLNLTNEDTIANFYKWCAESALIDSTGLNIFDSHGIEFKLFMLLKYYESEHGIVTSFKFHPEVRRYGSFIVDITKPGSHETYHIIHNSTCVGSSSYNEAEAQNEAAGIIENYLFNPHTKCETKQKT